MKHVLIGGGYISSNLVKSLKKNSPTDNVVVIGFDEVDFFDINDPENYSRSTEVFNDAVIYIFAAVSSDSSVRAHPELAVQTNIVGLTNLLSFLATECQPNKIIFLSSEWVYDEDADNALIGLDEKFSPYSQQKLCGEFIAQQFGKAYDIPVLILRLGIIWGRRESGGACESVAKKCFVASTSNDLSITVGNGQNARRFVHVDDLAFALSKVSGEPAGVYDVTGSEVISMEKLVNLCGVILNKKFMLTETNTNLSRRILNKSQIKTLSFTWQKVSFEDRLREHFDEFLL